MTNEIDDYVGKRLRRRRRLLGLTQQIRCAHFGIHRFVGNHQCFGGSGKQVDTDTTV